MLHELGEFAHFKPDPRPTDWGNRPRPPDLGVLLHHIHHDERGSISLRNRALLGLSGTLALTWLGLFVSLWVDPTNLSFSDMFARGVIGSFTLAGAVAAGSFLDFPKK